MLDRRFFAEAAAILVASILCATVANAVAGRERKLAWAGDYPNARVVPPAASPATPLPVPASAGETLDPGLAPAEPSISTGAPATSRAPATTAVPAKQPPAQAQAQPPAPRFSLADFPPHPDKPAVEIRPEQAIALHQLKATFIDARRSDAYRQGHIAGALSFPVWESDIDARVAAFYEEGHDQERPIVVYCSGGACEDSHMLAQKLWGLGFNNVQVYVDGYPDWVARGLATREGDAP
jgi:rhodanese-related sulfurtransferase